MESGKARLVPACEQVFSEKLKKYLPGRGRTSGIRKIIKRCLRKWKQERLSGLQKIDFARNPEWHESCAILLCFATGAKALCASIKKEERS
jgi:hypothetical protein